VRPKATPGVVRTAAKKPNPYRIAVTRTTPVALCDRYRSATALAPRPPSLRATSPPHPRRGTTPWASRFVRAETLAFYHEFSCNFPVLRQETN